MPHCIPQNEQWVFTSVSGASLADWAHPPGGVKFRCGPYRSTSSSVLAGASAMGLLLYPQLRGRECCAFARRAQALPVTGRTFDAVIESQLRQDRLQVLDLHLGRETFAAARAMRPFVFGARSLIHFYADLRGPLEDVKEF